MRNELVQAEQINQELDKLPVAQEVAVAWANQPADAFEVIQNRKGILVNGEIVSITSKGYSLVQHKDALRPVINGLTVTGSSDFRFSFFADNHRAFMDVFVGEGYDTVRYGFSVVNSYDRSTSLRYGFQGFRKTKIIEMIGYRQVCSNGMRVRVPLDQAEFVRPEERIQIESLLTKSLSIRHSGDVVKKMESVQPIVEAFMLLRNPLQRIIEAAQKVSVADLAAAEAIVEKYMGKRLRGRVLDHFVEKEQEKSLWGLFNSFTYLSSHEEKMSDSSRNALISKAAVMLEKELEVRVE